MLKRMYIKNMILIEKAEIEFKKGLNILSGESGSGKSTILEALRMILGDRADHELIREGSEKAIIEAEFTNLPKILFPILEREEITLETSESLILRREITIQGKNRTFVNDHAISLHVIKEIASYLVDFVGQHAYQELLNSQSARNFLDQYALLDEKVHELSNLWKKHGEIVKEIEQLKQLEPSRLREIDRCLMEKKELEESHLKEGEEETLFEEFKRLHIGSECVGKIDDFLNFLSSGRTPFISVLYRYKNQFQNLNYPFFLKAVKDLETVILELEELSYCFTKERETLDFDEKKMEKVELRLSLLSKLKKKYGSSLSEIMSYLTILNEKLNQLKKIPELLESKELESFSYASKIDLLSEEIHQIRLSQSLLFQEKITAELRSLNMSKVNFQIVLSEKELSANGKDNVEFYLAANLGEKAIPIHLKASGGELSRILLSLKTVLSNQTIPNCLIFDEIDANIGGKTAHTIGEKLTLIAEKRQILCITHLPQVAACAHHHLHIYKEEREGRTVTNVLPLDKSERKEELLRMMGGKVFCI